MLKVCVLTFACVLTLATAAAAADTRRLPSGAPVGIIIINGVPGESKTKAGGIDAKSISAIECSAPGAPAPAGAQASTHAVTSPRDAASGMATGKRMHKPITITKELDKSSPLLAKAAAAGTPIPRAVIERGGVTYELEGILIGLLKTGGGGGARPTETLTLNFAKCTRR